MQHRIPVESLGHDGAAMARAVETCVHCGFCLPACPTYRVLGEEMDSPRGRIVLMKQALEGDISISDALPFVDRCLGCLACVTACPSGVRYGELLLPFRARAEIEARSTRDRLRHRLLLTIMESPWLFRAARAGLIARRTGRLLPASVRRTLALLPATLPAPSPLPRFSAASGPRRARVALLAGCVQQVIAQRINHATLRTLTANGVDVVVPPGQACCGGLALHTGHAARASSHAARQVRVFGSEVDAIVTNAAGCGSAMKEYGTLLAGTPHEEGAVRFSSRVRDVSEFLDELGLVDPPPISAPLTIAYHDACHLAHAQRVRAAPRRVLASIPNLVVRDVPDGDICCGSAGLYNLEHPEVAQRLGVDKARAVMSTGAEAVVTGNVGCLVQLSTYLARESRVMPVWHTMELLASAYDSASKR
jgi:glycolate oxidase iron-sulfur subunit